MYARHGWPLRYPGGIMSQLRAAFRILVSSALLCPASALADEPGVGAAPAEASAPSANASQTVPPPGAPPILTGGYGGPTPPANAQPAAKGLSGQVSGAALFEKIDEDYFLTLDLQNELRIGPVGFGVWVPLRFRVWDRDPDNDGVFRQEDWDEVSDYARLLRFVELRLGGSAWRLRGHFGALDGESLGHGTVLAGYYNSLDRNHYQAGLVLDSAIRWGGVELMLDNLLAPEIFGLRLHVRPTSFFTKNQWANRLIVGLSYTADARAPAALSPDPTRSPVQPAVDGEQNLVVAGRDHLGVLGVDLEYAVIQNKLIDLVPYLDLNFMFDGGGGSGAGMHLGTFFNLRIPTPIGPTLLTRLEYRLVGSGYAPRYFDSLYETQRLEYDASAITDPSGLPLTKLAWLRLGSSGKNGWLGELYFDFAGWLRVGGTYEDYEGPNNSALTLSLLLPKLKLIQLGATYTRRGFDSLADAFDKDGAMLLCYARVAAYGPLFISATYSRAWHLESGRYQVEDDFSVGAGVAFSY
jgi:hypothetical protein